MFSMSNNRMFLLKDIYSVSDCFSKNYLTVLVCLTCIMIFASSAVYCGELKNSEKKIYETYKKLKSKDIILTVMQGNAYVMVSPTRWERALTGVKLLVGDKLKITEDAVAVINFYDEFDIKVPASEMTTIEPDGLTQLINGALFKTAYKDGAYISEVVKEPSKAAQYKMKSQMQKRDSELSYAKNKYSMKEEAFRKAAAENETNEGNYLRARVAQARNFGNGFALNYNESENKLAGDKNSNYLVYEKQRLEREIMFEMTTAENLKAAINQKKNSGLNYTNEQQLLDQANMKLRELMQKADITESEIKKIRETNNKINFNSSKKEW